VQVESGSHGRQISVALQGNKTLTEYAALGRLAEDLGFDGVSVYADLGFQPAIGPLLAIAQRTERVWIGPATLNTWLVHPVEIAGQIALLDAVSNGRAYLGLARGAWLDGIGIDEQRPVRRLREAIGAIRHVLAGREDGFESDLFPIPKGKLLQYPVLRSEVPLLIGTWGPKLAALAGEVTAEVKIGGSTNPAMVPVMRSYLEVGEARVGRRPGSVGIALGAVTVVDDDGARARAWVRREAARYLPVVAPLDPTLDAPKELLERMAALVAVGEDDEAAALVPDDLLDRFAFSGTPEQIIRQVEALFDAGATRVEFGTPHGFTDDGGIRLLGERVLPAFRS
jgi:5,10-methylenetetrahydromethanopterin reductase